MKQINYLEFLSLEIGDPLYPLHTEMLPFLLISFTFFIFYIFFSDSLYVLSNHQSIKTFPGHKQLCKQSYSLVGQNLEIKMSQKHSWKSYESLQLTKEQVVFINICPPTSLFCGTVTKDMLRKPQMMGALQGLREQFSPLCSQTVFQCYAELNFPITVLTFLCGRMCISVKQCYERTWPPKRSFMSFYHR